MDGIYTKKILTSLGYSNEYLSDNYAVQINGTSAIRFDCVAFSDKYQKDVSTSCIAVQEIADDNDEQRYIDGAKYLATPIIMISQGNHIRVWNISTNKNNLLMDNTDNIIQLYFEKNRFEFMSDTLINVKMGYKQINIFEASGLIDFSRAATCKILSNEFESGLIAAKNFLKSKKKINGQDLNNLTSITMHMISALIINSKVNSKDTIPNIFELLEKLSKTYNEYFSNHIMLKYGKELLVEIYNNLNKSINYQSVDHELLGYFYESTLLQLSEKKAEAIRKEFGIYYTPKILGKEITQCIPFENITVDNRYVLDGTCGSGSLLLSACKRLEDLVDGEKKEFEKHNYLTKLIQGYDIDKFASEVARLSLLLYSLPYGNKWNVKSGDLLRVNVSDINKPYIILGNPPYEETRKNKKKNQKATAFLDKYLEWLQDDGYLGIILPESFLQNDSSEMERKKLLNEFDIMELWMLPGQIFENNCSTIVIIAQKKVPSKETFTKIKLLVKRKEAINNYMRNNKWSFKFFENAQTRWKNNEKSVINISPIDDVLSEIAKGKRTLGDITNNVMGIMLPSDYSFSTVEHHNVVPYISNAKNFQKYVMSKKMVNSIEYLNYHMTKEEEAEIKNNYPGLRLRKNHEQIFLAKSKILVKMSSTPGEIECINALVDDERYYPSHSFFAISSKDSVITNEVLCALINSRLINAFVRKECVKRTLTTKVVKSIPIPDFNKEQLDTLEASYLKIKRAYTEANYGQIEILQKTIDDVIFDAFKLNADECVRIDELYDIYMMKGIDEEKEEQKHEKYYNVSGEVEEINIENKTCKIYLAEFGELIIPIGEEMPGWFLREKAEFSAKYCNERLYDIHPLLYSSLTDDEIVALLRSELKV